MQNKSNAPSEDNLALLCSGSGDQADAYLGQDDSALHGKQLPPSPRKRVSSGGVTGSLFILQEGSSERPLGTAHGHGPVAARPASSPDPGSQLPSAAQTDQGKAEKETLSQVSDDQLIPSLGRRSSTSVPWEKDGKAKETSEDGGQLRQGGSLCSLTSAFQQDLHGSEGDARGIQAAAGGREPGSCTQAAPENPRALGP